MGQKRIITTFITKSVRRPGSPLSYSFGYCTHVLQGGSDCEVHHHSLLCKKKVGALGWKPFVPEFLFAGELSEYAIKKFTCKNRYPPPPAHLE